MNGLGIVLCRNNVHHSQECVNSLLNQTAMIDILIVNNASSDSTAAWARAKQAKHDNIWLMTMRTVASVAWCWNQALYWAWNRGHEEALVVNNDTVLLPGMYEQLSTYLHFHPKTAMVTGVSVEKNPTYPTQVTSRPNPDYSAYMIRQKTHKRVPFNNRFEGAYCEDQAHHVEMIRAGMLAESINMGFLHYRSATKRHADKEELERIDRNHKHNLELFKELYGCYPWTRGYEELFHRPTEYRVSKNAKQNESHQGPRPVIEGVGLARNIVPVEPHQQPQNH